MQTEKVPYQHTFICTRLGSFTLLSPDMAFACISGPDHLACYPTAADGQAGGTEAIRAERQKGAVLLWWGEWWRMRRGLLTCICSGVRREFSLWNMFAFLHLGVVWSCFGTYFSVCHPLLDPQPVYDVCGLQSCQGVHCGQDGACSGQDLWLLWTRCASDEYLKELHSRKTTSMIYERLPLFCGNGTLKT